MRPVAIAIMLAAAYAYYSPALVDDGVIKPVAVVAEAFAALECEGAGDDIRLRRLPTTRDQRRLHLLHLLDDVERFLQLRRRWTVTGSDVSMRQRARLGLLHRRPPQRTRGHAWSRAGRHGWRPSIKTGRRSADARTPGQKGHLGFTPE